MNKVAVVVVCTNQGKYLNKLFESLDSQTYQDFDIFFYDNYSIDDSYKIADDYYNKKEETPVGRRMFFCDHDINASLPIGITRWDVVRIAIDSEHQYIALLDADDFWHERKLELQVKYLEENPNVKMMFSDCFYYNDEKQEVEDKTFFRKNKPYKKDFFWKLLTKRNFMPCCTLMFDAEALKEVIGAPTNYTSAEDYDWVLKMANKFDVGCVDLPLAYYRIHPNQVSRNKTRCTSEEIDVVKSACKLRELARKQGMRVYIHLLWLYIKLLLKEYSEAETYLRGLE